MLTFPAQYGVKVSDQLKSHNCEPMPCLSLCIEDLGEGSFAAPALHLSSDPSFSLYPGSILTIGHRIMQIKMVHHKRTTIFCKTSICIRNLTADVKPFSLSSGA